MNADLAGRVVVVTGASSGIGRASALAAGRSGARVMLVARDAEALDAVAD
ncbi:MAG TPA: SDR family NAD(P)-dependent oxidoreductase, partial [Caulobacteraceae bacterium]